jgi:hypothetical protein
VGVGAGVADVGVVREGVSTCERLCLQRR